MSIRRLQKRGNNRVSPFPSSFIGDRSRSKNHAKNVVWSISSFPTAPGRALAISCTVPSLMAGLAGGTPFADLDPPQTFVLRADEILANERRMVWPALQV